MGNDKVGKSTCESGLREVQEGLRGCEGRMGKRVRARASVV